MIPSAPLSTGSLSLPCSLLAALVTTTAIATTPTTPAPPEHPETTHTLFMGSDISIEWNGKLYPVQHVQGGAFIINADGKRVAVPTLNANVTLKLEDNLKLTPRTATVTDLAADRAYTPANDPTQKFARMVNYTTFQMTDEDIAMKDLRAADTVAGMTAAAAAVADPRNTTVMEMAATAATQAQAAAFNNSQVVERRFSSMNDVDTHLSRMGTEMMQEQYDALRLSFKVSSAEPLNEPYLVVVARFLENPDDPKSLRQLVYAQEMSAIGNKPLRIQLFRGGFPPGYALQEYRIHLYDHGNEVATTVARKRVALTTEDAFQYSVIEYLARNRAKDTVATPARAFWPADLRSRLAAIDPGKTVYVKVGKDGKPEGAFEDEEGQRPLADAGLAAMIGEIRFFPALSKGKSVAGLASLPIGKPAR